MPPIIKSWSAPLPLAFSRAIARGLIADVVLILLSALMLDGGRAFRLMLIVALAHLLAMGIIAVRRAQAATWADLLIVRWGGLMAIAGLLPWL